MDLAAFLPFMPIVASSLATFRSGLDCATIKNCCRRLFLLAFGQADQSSQILDHIFKYASRNPTLGLLVHGKPGWQIIGHHPPLGSRSHNPSQTVEDGS